MIDKSIFRQYDIRGIVNKNLDENSAKLIGYYFGKYLKEKYNEEIYIVIGYDIRHHSKLLFEALVSGINFSDCKVINIGLVATGVNYFASFQEIEIEKNKK